jgi:hypothetical protein
MGRFFLDVFSHQISLSLRLPVISKQDESRTQVTRGASPLFPQHFDEMRYRGQLG